MIYNLSLSIITSVVLLLNGNCKELYISPDDVITINGHITGLNNRKILLSASTQWKIILDSAQVSNDTFTFHYKFDKDFEPFSVCLTFLDTTGKLRTLAFINPYISTPGSIKRYGAFVMEGPEINITGDYTTNIINIQAGEETEVFFKTGMGINFAYLGKQEGAARKANIDNCKAMIKKYPASYTLMHGLFLNKDQYSNAEIRELLGLFHPGMKHSSNGRRLLAYIRIRPDAGQPVPVLTLLSAAGEWKPIIDSTAQLNMVIFWASWCGPCKLEIPSLKEIYAAYHHKGLHMASVSIDKDSAAWKKSLGILRPAWQQFIALHEQKEEVEALYNLSSIPLVIFTDNKGWVLSGYSGYSEDNKEKFIRMIDHYLKQTTTAVRTN